jgi:hypothetical protein
LNILKKSPLIGLPGALSVDPRMSASVRHSLAAQLPNVSPLTARIGERIASELQSRLAQAVAAPRAAHPVCTASGVAKVVTIGYYGGPIFIFKLTMGFRLLLMALTPPMAAKPKSQAVSIRLRRPTPRCG